VSYVPYPGMYWAAPSEEDIGVRETSWDARVEQIAKSTGGPENDSFVSRAEVNSMEQDARLVGGHLCKEARSLAEQGDYDKAAEAYAQALDKYKLAEDSAGLAEATAGAASMAQRKEVWQEATAVRGQAAKLMQEGKFTEASAKYTEAEEAYTRCENTVGAKRAKEGRGESEARCASQESASGLCEEAEALMQGREYTAATAKYDEAEAQFRMAHDAAGLKRATEAKAKAKLLLGALNQASALLDKGQALMKKHKPDQAVDVFDQARAKFEEGNDEAGAQKCKARIADANGLIAENSRGSGVPAQPSASDGASMAESS